MDFAAAALIGGLVASGIVGFFLKSYLPGYLGEKGKNLATKEDIAGITHKVEEVKNQYALLLEATKFENQLRVAALDRRLEVAQEAFTLWRKLLKSANLDNWSDVVLECETWWEANCLYLGDEVRVAFSEAFFATHTHQELLEERASPAEITANFERLSRLGGIIAQSVALPGLTNAERSEVADQTGRAVRK